jgi:hypothetical protein
MLRRFGVTGFSVCYAPAGDAGTAGGGGGAAVAELPAGGAGGGDAGDGQAADAGDADAGDGGAALGDEFNDDDLLGDDDDAQQQTRTAEEQIAAMRRANKKLRKQVLKSRTLNERVKGVDLDTLMARDRQLRSLEEAARRNPRLRALLSEDTAAGDEPDRSTRRQENALPALPTAFTAETLGFDPNDGTANRVLATAIQHVAELSRTVAELKRLTPTVQNLERSVSARTASEERQEWEGALSSLDAALKEHMPGNTVVARFARDAMVGAFHSRANHKQSPKAIVKGYIDDLVKSGQLSKKQGAQATASVQSRMAAHNQTLPKSPAGGGAPASAQGNQRPTLKDIHKRLRTGQIGPR